MLHDFRASKWVDWWTLWRSETTIHTFWSFKIEYGMDSLGRKNAFPQIKPIKTFFLEIETHGWNHHWTWSATKYRKQWLSISQVEKTKQIFEQVFF